MLISTPVARYQPMLRMRPARKQPVKSMKRQSRFSTENAGKTIFARAQLSAPPPLTQNVAVWLEIPGLGLRGFSLWFHLPRCHIGTFFEPWPRVTPARLLKSSIERCSVRSARWSRRQDLSVRGWLVSWDIRTLQIEEK